MRYTAIIALPLLLSIACFLPVQAESDSALFGTEAERLVSRGMRHYNNQDYGSAFRCFRQAAETGDAYAQYNLALCYHKGEGVEEDLREAKRWYRAAAEQGYVYAQYSLAEFCRCGDGGEKDMSEAVKWYRAAAQQGHSGAQNSLGRCYENGSGVQKNAVEAVKWYRAAAQQGHPGAQYSLGNCYVNGQGVFKDVAEAEKWYRKAAEQGDETSREALQKLQKEKNMPVADELISKGEAFLENQEYKDAVECFLVAAQMRNAHAMYYLGLCYEKGLGVKKNSLAAQLYYGDALALGDKDAEKGWERMFRKNEKKFRQILKCARQGDSRFYLHVGCAYRDGLGVDRDAEKARYWLRKAADKGDLDAQRELREMGEE